MTDDFTFDDKGAFSRLAVALANASAKAGAAAYQVTQQYGVMLHGRVKANAAGRPGPRIQTGDYSRAINLRMGTGRGGVSASVGTNKPQGRRLEFGFAGADSLGRNYNQPPYPHFGPALAEVGPKYRKAIEDLATGVVEDAVDGTGMKGKP